MPRSPKAVISTLVASDGAAALALVDQGAEFDLLFTDVVMPGGMNGRHFALLVVMLAIGFAGLVLSSPYRMHRIFGFMDPWNDAFGTGYQLSHALIAFGRGGSLETVIGLGETADPQAATGIFFREQTAESLGEAILGFVKIEASFSPEFIRAQAQHFSRERFIEEFGTFAAARTAEFQEGTDGRQRGEYSPLRPLRHAVR